MILFNNFSDSRLGKLGGPIGGRYHLEGGPFPSEWGEENPRHKATVAIPHIILTFLYNYISVFIIILDTNHSDLSRKEKKC
jgi:hypothetical protein